MYEPLDAGLACRAHDVPGAVYMNSLEGGPALLANYSDKVNYRVSTSHGRRQTFTAHNVSSCGRDPYGHVRVDISAQPRDVVAGLYKLSAEVAAYEPRGAGDENAHPDMIVRGSCRSRCCRACKCSRTGRSVSALRERLRL